MVKDDENQPISGQHGNFSLGNSFKETEKKGISETEKKEMSDSA